MLDTDEDRRTDIEVELSAHDAPGFAAVVRLRGEHDIATSPQIREALAPIHGNVLIDLSECEFVDSSVLYVIVTAAQERTRAGQRLELLVPSENARIARTLEVSGLSDVLTSRTSIEPA